MAKFIIQPHGRLNDWVADEKGYFRDEGLEYELNVDDGRANAGPVQLVNEGGDVPDVMAGAFESYAEGHGRKGEGAGDISCACHWTVNQAAKVEEGVMWGDAYSIGDAAVMVAEESDITSPEDLAGRNVAVGYHSGSHYSAIQALEAFIPADRINLKFAGLPWSRVELALARKIDAVNVWGPQRYVLEQQGFRKIADATFIMTFMFPHGTDRANVSKYMNGLRRAQMDIDLEPERHKHHFLNEVPKHLHGLIDIRRFGVGERVVFLPYTQEMFETTQAWMHARNLFDVGPEVGVSYDAAVTGAA